MNIQNFKIATRLGTSFAVILLMLIAVAWLGLSRMGKIQTTLVEITNGNNVEANMAGEMQNSVADRMIALRNIVLFTNPTEVQKEVERIKAQAEKYYLAERNLKAAFAIYGMRGEEVDLVARLKADDEAAQPLIRQVTILGQANKTTEAVQVLTGNLRTVQKRWNADLIALADSEKRQNDEAAVEADVTYSFARTLMLTLSGVAVIVGAALAWFITQGITKPLSRAMAVAQMVASGNLTSQIDVHARDETGLLLEALKTMNNNLKEIVGQVRTGTETMSTASQQIAAGNLDLSSRTEQQASALEETASSMEELTSTVKQNAENARQASSQAVAASEIAMRGGTVMEQVVGTMDTIYESSKKIEEIISVIEGIAFQTNILALNAAVEAARAGEQGRGFAVVATEVRNLAHRSSAASKEIKALITDSVQKVETGTKLVKDAGFTMKEVVGSVRSVREIIAEITVAGREQVLGIEQINQAIIQMDGVTQQNAALVEQSAAAAESLQNQARDLAQVVSAFVLEARASSTARIRSLVSWSHPKVSTIVKLQTHGRLANIPLYARTPKQANGTNWEKF